WIDRVRRPQLPIGPVQSTAGPPLELRDAAGTLLVQLAPQERAAVVLKDAFDFSLDEIAGIIGTTVGAVKAALHRGRGKLLEPDVETSRVPAHTVVDAFCAAFNAHDVERLTALLLDRAVVEVVGATASHDTDEVRSQMLRGMLFGSQRLANAATQGGIEARFVSGALPTPPRAEKRVYRGEAIALLWYHHHDGEHVRAINRIEADGSRIVRLQNFFFTPDLVAEVCAELGASHRPNGYRWWLTREGCP
ncbi:MAG: sigma factor-like helix-turn-helix DNA-binding protein, partial [Polyangia bacterium]